MGDPHEMLAPRRLDSGQHKFEICSSRAPGISDEIQLATDEIIGLGSRQYDMRSSRSG